MRMRFTPAAFPGYAIGGLAVGESTQTMYDIIDAVEPYMPKDKTRYLMGVGTPSNIIEGVARGVDFFDCVMPARNARHAKLFPCYPHQNPAGHSLLSCCCISG